jgi:hypothetical protein
MPIHDWRGIRRETGRNPPDIRFPIGQEGVPRVRAGGLFSMARKADAARLVAVEAKR